VFKGLTLQLILSRLPLVLGGLVAIFLLIMIWIAIQEPATLEEYIGVNGTLSTPAAAKNGTNTTIPAVTSTPATKLDKTHIISYENYTRFPLLGTEYREECEKLNGGFMAHGDYWNPPMHGLLDVPHVPSDNLQGEATKICSSSITYQLDGNVGLLADLALMAQAAALAREVHR